MPALNKVFLTGNVVRDFEKKTDKLGVVTIAQDIWNGKEAVAHFYNITLLGEKNVSSAEKDKQKQRKYVLDAEFKDYLCTGHSVVIYQHRPRVNEAVYINRMMQRFMSLSPDVRRSDVQVITFPRYSVRDYFAISINEDHRLKIKRAISNLVNGVWGSGKKPMCRLPISIENALSNETPNSPTKLHSPTKPGSNVGE